MTALRARRPFTVDEYHKLAEIGVLHEGDRVELLNGDVVNMAPVGDGHVSYVVTLISLLSDSLGTQVHINVQNPIRLSDDTEPQPDIVLLERGDGPYLSGLPSPEAVLLLIEVQSTTTETRRFRFTHSLESRRSGS